MSVLRRLWDDYGQAVWLDYIRRDLVAGGGLARLVEVDGVRGVTSNPSIFKGAITGGDEYREAIADELLRRPQSSPEALYERLAIDDIRMAADVLRPVWEEADRGDGFVSLEVSPDLAADASGTVAEARRLWREVSRPNLMVKVPATAAGLEAIEALIADGVNVNATLIFSLAHYEGVATAYLRGLERSPEPARVASVASFFVSRVDTAVDRQLDEIGSEAARELRGRAAIANSRRAYRRFEELFADTDFARLRRRGARVQRPLWASTSTKDPTYSDVLYVEELVAEQTVNTIPTATLDAFRDHGRAQAGLRAGIERADEELARLAALGVDLERVTERLQVDGVAAFKSSFDELLAALGRQLDGVGSGR